jgi:S-DNA-T family DNA segregation ATPase FtsK/SpoIIIE
MNDQSWQLPEVHEVLESALAPYCDESLLRTRADIIKDTLRSFSVPVGVVEVNSGPRETQFVVQPPSGRRSRRSPKFSVRTIQARAQDLALALAVGSVSVEPSGHGQQGVAIWVPNAELGIVALRDVLESEAFDSLTGRLRLGLGQDASGMAVVADLRAMPHLLIAGTVRSGKSICIHALIAALLLQNTPDMLRLVMVDTKRIELSCYNGIPHLLQPVIVEMEKAIPALCSVTQETTTRFQHFEKIGARDIDEFNLRVVESDMSPLPYIVVIMDEIADLALELPSDFGDQLGKLAQAGHSTGIYLIVATNRPSIDVIARSIKGNFPARIAFKVTSHVESRIILDRSGAEQLLSDGDMLFLAPDSDEPLRVQGAFVSDHELKRLVNYWRNAKQSEPSRP